MKYHIRKHIIIFPFIIILSAIIISCKGNRSHKEYSYTDKILSEIEDSLQTNIEYSKQLSYKGIKESTDSIDKCLFYVTLGKIYFLSYKEDSMRIFINKALQYVNNNHSPKTKTYDILFSGYETLANNFYLYRHGDSAIYYHKKAFETLKKSSKTKLLSNVAANLADVYLQNENMPMAAEWYNRSLHIADSLNVDKEKYASIYMGLAQVYLYLRDYELSKRYYDLAGYSYSILPTNLKSYYLNNYGNYFYYRKDYRKALQVFKKLKAILDEHKEMIYDNYLCRLNIADVFLQMNMPDSTKYYLKGCHEYFNNININDAVYYVNTQNIGIAIKENNMEKVKKILQNEKINVIKNNNLKRIRDNYLIDYYSKISDYKDAYNILLKSKNEEDSLELNRNRMRAAEIMMRYHNDTLSLHKQIIIEKKNSDIKRVSFLLLSSIGSLILLLAVFATFLMYYKKKKLQNRLDIMELRLINLRNRISPHFIFNVLNHELENKEREEGCIELTLLASLLRDSLKMTEFQFVTIEDELSFVERYIRLESYIFDNDFSYEINIKLKNKNIISTQMIPTMFIQILVENAIKHGLKNKTGDKKLYITVYSEDNNVIISIKDNGVGFNIAHNNGSTHVGLNVIRKTLALLNHHMKYDIKFKIHNICDKNNSIEGCESLLIIPMGIRKYKQSI